MIAMARSINSPLVGLLEAAPEAPKSGMPPGKLATNTRALKLVGP